MSDDYDALLEEMFGPDIFDELSEQSIYPDTNMYDHIMVLSHERSDPVNINMEVLIEKDDKHLYVSYESGNNCGFRINNASMDALPEPIRYITYPIPISYDAETFYEFIANYSQIYEAFLKIMYDRRFSVGINHQFEKSLQSEHKFDIDSDASATLITPTKKLVDADLWTYIINSKYSKIDSVYASYNKRYTYKRFEFPDFTLHGYHLSGLITYPDFIPNKFMKSIPKYKIETFTTYDENIGTRKYFYFADGNLESIEEFLIGMFLS